MSKQFWEEEPNTALDRAEEHYERRIAELEAEIERLRTELQENWEHSWKCKHQSNKTGECICGLPETLLGGEGTEE